MAITAADVKKLRDATGAGMMDAKKALTEAEGDFDKAIELLRISGLAKAAKRADREATNGIVAGRDGALIQFAAETDFVAKNAEFVGLAEEIVGAVLAAKASDLAAANEAPLASGAKVLDAVQELGAKIGENLSLANVALFEGDSHLYLHRRAADLPPQVGVLIEYRGSEDLAHQVALQIAAMSPSWVNREDVPAENVENERRIAEATAREEGKPEAVLGRIVEGRLGGYYKDVVLVDQAAIWVEDNKTVGQALTAGDTEIVRFARFAVGA